MSKCIPFVPLDKTLDILSAHVEEYATGNRRKVSRRIQRALLAESAHHTAPDTDTEIERLGATVKDIPGILWEGNPKDYFPR